MFVNVCRECPVDYLSFTTCTAHVNYLGQLQLGSGDRIKVPDF